MRSHGQLPVEATAYQELISLDKSTTIPVNVSQMKDSVQPEQGT